ncbi:hypothetical protein BD311DRAFT_762007 [Dichomitus squalens]|uniref:Uncharacterized protein n=1 Tax=Dichomitus squalens TaxID=114155 RepID=A0A4Q9MJ32_9APHY|nr:hypothetical protein BD311DRAFT_762007 [Dichomitus squalens]
MLETWDSGHLIVLELVRTTCTPARHTFLTDASYPMSAHCTGRPPCSPLGAACQCPKLSAS